MYFNEFQILSTSNFHSNQFLIGWMKTSLTATIVKFNGLLAQERGGWFVGCDDKRMYNPHPIIQKWRTKMSKIVSVHSFRGGTGKSNITANLASILAMEGLRVGVVDTDIVSPGIHVLFGLDESSMGRTLNDFLHGQCEIEDAAFSVRDNTVVDRNVEGRNKLVGKNLWLIPSSIRGREISRVLREGYDVNRLNEGLQKLISKMKLHYLFIDTHPGLNEETLLSIAISDALIIIMRPDQQDYQGTAVTVDIALSLDVPRMLMVVNKVPSVLDFDDVRQRVEQTYNAQVAAVLPHSDEMMALASSDIFSLKYPDHPISKALVGIAQELKK
jgi:septum site-determining protein MinD